MPSRDRRARRRPVTAAAEMVAAVLVMVGLVAGGLVAVARHGVRADADSPPATSAPVRVMPLGDSITASPGCWRALLWQRLRRAGFTRLDFVGTQDGSGACPGPHDGDHEGHPGFTVTGIADRDLLAGWVAADPPDVVLVHLGTNDVLGRRTPTPAILAAHTKLLARLRAANPSVRVLVARIIPIAASRCADCDRQVVELNRAILPWAAANSTNRSPVTVVDQYTGFDPRTDTGDGVHPNRAGEAKIADRWFPALVTVVTGRTPSPHRQGVPRRSGRGPAPAQALSAANCATMASRSQVAPRL